MDLRARGVMIKMGLELGFSRASKSSVPMTQSGQPLAPRLLEPHGNKHALWRNQPVWVQALAQGAQNPVPPCSEADSPKSTGKVWDSLSQSKGWRPELEPLTGIESF